MIKKQAKDYIKNSGYIDWELAELYVRLKRTMELEIELIKKLDDNIKFIDTSFILCLLLKKT